MPANSLKLPQCLECMDTGMLPDTVYYPFCDLYGQKYCACPSGDIAFKKWCQRKEVQHSLKQKRLEEIQKSLAFSNIPKRWQDITLESLEGHETLKQKINMYFDHFQKHRKHGRGIYLWADHDPRKKTTQLLSVICRELINRFVVPCIFMTEKDILRKIRESFKNSETSEYECLKRFRSIPCLFIDGLMSGRITPWRTEILGDILDHRFDNALPTFFSSRYKPDDYCRNHSCPAETFSRISQMCADFILEIPVSNAN